MLFYHRTGISEGTDSVKVIAAKNAWFFTNSFFNHGFKFQKYFCTGCHDLTILCLNISDITNATTKWFNYRCIIFENSKSVSIHLLDNYVLEDCSYI